jgi:hypothetical protein
MLLNKTIDLNVIGTLKNTSIDYQVCVSNVKYIIRCPLRNVWVFKSVNFRLLSTFLSIESVPANYQKFLYSKQN